MIELWITIAVFIVLLPLAFRAGMLHERVKWDRWLLKSLEE